LAPFTPLAFFLGFWKIAAMSSLQKKIRCEEQSIRIAEELRKWEKRQKSRRCSLVALARSLNVSVERLRRRRSSRSSRQKKKAAEAKKKILVEAQAKYKWLGVKSAYERGKKIPIRSDFYSKRSCRRIAEPARKSYREKKKKYWVQWHKDNPNMGITQEQLDSLYRCSPGWA